MRPPPPLATQPVCERSACDAASPRDVGPSGQGLARCSLTRQRCAERAACGALSCTRFAGTVPTTALHTARKSGAAPPTPSPARSSEARAGAECGAGAGGSAEAEHFVELAGRPFLEVPPAPPPLLLPLPVSLLYTHSRCLPPAPPRAARHHRPRPRGACAAARAPTGLAAPLTQCALGTTQVLVAARAGQVATRVNDDRVLVLVDMKQHTESHMLQAVALRPAPLQVAWLGFPGGVSPLAPSFLFSLSPSFSLSLAPCPPLQTHTRTRVGLRRAWPRRSAGRW